METDIGYLVRDEYEGETVVVYPLRMPNTEARMATAFIERWGMVAARPDGEDSAGRQKLSLLTPEELVGRACATAKLACQEFEKRGWMLHVPAPTNKRRA